MPRELFNVTLKIRLFPCVQDAEVDRELVGAEVFRDVPEMELTKQKSSRGYIMRGWHHYLIAVRSWV